MKEKGALEGMWAWAETFSQSLVQKIKLEEPDMHSRLVLVRKKKTEEVLQRRHGTARDDSSRANGHRTVLRMKPHEEESMPSGNDAQRQDEQDAGGEEANRTTEIRATAVNKPSESQMRIIRKSRNLDELNDWLSAVRERADRAMEIEEALSSRIRELEDEKGLSRSQAPSEASGRRSLLREQSPSQRMSNRDGRNGKNGGGERSDDDENSEEWDEDDMEGSMAERNGGHHEFFHHGGGQDDPSEYSDRTVRVVHVHEDSPAGREGNVQVGDILKRIGEEEVYRKSISQVAPRILGKRGTVLRLGLLRQVEGQWKEMAISLRREPRHAARANGGQQQQEDEDEDVDHGEEEEEEQQQESKNGHLNNKLGNGRDDDWRSSSRSNNSVSSRGGGGGGGGGSVSSHTRSQRSEKHARASDSLSQASSRRSSSSKLSSRSGTSRQSARGGETGREERGGESERSSGGSASSLTAADRCLLHFAFFGKLAEQMQDLPNVLLDLEVPLPPVDEQWLLMELEKRMRMCDDETSSSVTEGFISDTSSVAGSAGWSDGSVQEMQQGKGRGGRKEAGRKRVGIEDYLLGRTNPQVDMRRRERSTGRKRMSGTLCVRRKKEGVAVWHRRFFVLFDSLELVSFRSKRRFERGEPPEARRVIAGNKVGAMPSSFQQRHSFFLSRREKGGGNMLVLSAPSEAARRAWIDQIALLCSEETIHMKRMWEEEGLAPDASAAKIVDFLLDLNADVNCQNRRGCSPLHFAAQNGDVASCRALLLASSGLRLEAKDEDGLTAQKIAKKARNLEIEALIKDAMENEEQEIVL
ncbi:hypothetical protein GUITHDRAFT_132849 [Guillardia theta CCMP2712]|uniref:PH domain-containing protein n=1 Tax=Guillardia theta (strain CCMP2712) TaxID=905079 RepID=L1K054_GUITC|nr:hypothetical protein GUITHDRAFT_132849 [Guillardia theta CCMP2712]EKX53800.1 hypothetical protein GUITHDRAFT_132849 [Guillardia theta CCMP2712]|eukprot:XP_005840780.1 hypothetical protein GUITHDRAFT_132849 [Guillardia theta CCMP2712]